MTVSLSVSLSFFFSLIAHLLSSSLDAELWHGLCFCVLVCFRMLCVCFVLISNMIWLNSLVIFISLLLYSACLFSLPLPSYEGLNFLFGVALDECYIDMDFEHAYKFLGTSFLLLYQSSQQ